MLRLALAVAVLGLAVPQPVLAQRADPTHVADELANCRARSGAGYPAGFCDTPIPTWTATPLPPTPTQVIVVVAPSDTPTITPTPTATPCWLPNEDGTGYLFVLNDDETDYVPVPCPSPTVEAAPATGPPDTETPTPVPSPVVIQQVIQAPPLPPQIIQAPAPPPPPPEPTYTPYPTYTPPPSATPTLQPSATPTATQATPTATLTATSTRTPTPGPTMRPVGVSGRDDWPFHPWEAPADPPPPRVTLMQVWLGALGGSPLGLAALETVSGTRALILSYFDMPRPPDPGLPPAWLLTLGVLDADAPLVLAQPENWWASPPSLPPDAPAGRDLERWGGLPAWM
jgi:hypothetical protein